MSEHQWEQLRARGLLVDDRRLALLRAAAHLPVLLLFYRQLKPFVPERCSRRRQDDSSAGLQSGTAPGTVLDDAVASGRSFRVDDNGEVVYLDRRATRVCRRESDADRRVSLRGYLRTGAVVALLFTVMLAAVNPFGSGTRPWARKTLVKIAANSTVMPAGEIIADDSGGVYGTDGVTSVKNLARLARVVELAGFAKDGTLAQDATKGANALLLDGSDETARLSALSAQALGAGLPILRMPPTAVFVKGWTPTSGVTYYAPTKASTIKMHPSSQGTADRTVIASDTTDVTFIGLTIDGNRSAYTGAATEQRHGLIANHVTRFNLYDVTITNTVGDGVYFGMNTNGQCSAVSAFRLRCIGNWRNGMSLISCDGGTFTDCIFDTTAGTAPQAGVDIEPNDNTAVLRGVKFFGGAMTGNAAYGLAITMYPGGTQGGIRVVGVTIRSSGTANAYLYSANDVEFNGCQLDSATGDGVIFQAGAFTDVRFIGGSISLNGKNGINCQPTTAKTSAAAGTATIQPSVKGLRIIGVTVVDNGSSNPNFYFGILLDAAVSGSTVVGAVDGPIVVNNVAGNRTTTNQKYGLYLSIAVQNSLVDKNDFRGNATSAAIFNDDAATRKRGVNLGVSTVVSATGNFTVPSAAEWVPVTGLTAAATVTLPAAPEVTRDYTIYSGDNTAASFAVTIAPNTGQSWANNGKANPTISTDGGTVRCFFRGNRWYLVAKTP